MKVFVCNSCGWEGTHLKTLTVDALEVCPQCEEEDNIEWNPKKNKNH